MAEATDECNASHTNKLAQLRFLFEEGRKVKVLFSFADLPLHRISFAELEIALEAKDLEFQILHGLAAESVTLCTEATQL